MDYVFMALGLIVRLQFYVAATLLYLSGMLLDLILQRALTIQNLSSVDKGWSIARDTVNMFFVIFLLVIAFATILRIEAYQYKALLPKLIVSILLVNFSRTICTVLIEFSNVLTGAFLNFAPGRSTPAAIAALLGLEHVFQVPESLSVTNITNLTMLTALMFHTVFVAVLAFAFVGLTGMLLMRTVGLLVLIVISPLAFAMNILPITKSYFSKWWESFIKFLFYAPIASFFLYLAAMVASDARQSSGPVALGYSVTNSSGDAASTVNIANVLPTSFTVDVIWEWALVIGLLFTGIMMIKEGGGTLANFAMNAAQKGLLGGGKMLAGWGRRKVAGETFGKGAQKLRKSPWTWGLGALGGGLHTAARLTYAPAAWKAQAEKEEHEVGSMSTGWARNKINKAFSKIPGAAKDSTDYKHGAYMELVDEELKRQRIENPGESWQFLVNEIKESAGKVGEEDTVEASIRTLVSTKNINELISAASADEELGKKLYSNKKYIGEYSPEALQDMLENQFGHERGRSMVMEIGEQGAANGNWLCKDYLRRASDNSLMAPGDKDPKTGKTYSKGDFHKTWAGELSKRDIRDRVSLYRGDINKMVYVNGEEKHMGPTEGMKEYIKEYGFGGQDAYRAAQSMNPRLKKNFVETEHFAGKKDKSGIYRGGMADTLRDQFESKDPQIKDRARGTLQFYYEMGEAATMGSETQEAMEQLVNKYQVALDPPGRGTSNYGFMRKYNEKATTEEKATRGKMASASKKQK